MNFYRLLSVVVAAALSLFAAAGQSRAPQTPEEKEKQLLDMVDNEVQRLSGLLKLEDWQEFYVDSTLTHDFKAMMEEMETLQRSKVENPDLYVAARDKWMQQISDTYRKFFTPEQWNKFWKSGEKKDQAARDKRKQK